MAAIRILGLDPGTANFGWAVTEFKGDSYRPLAAGKIINSVKQMENTVSQTDEFLTELLAIIKKYKPRYIIAERFLNRGRFNGATGEYVSFMMGVIATYALNNPDTVKGFYIVHSGTWKGAYNRLSKTKGLLDKVYKYTLSEPHEIDAYLLSHFCLKEINGGAGFGHLGAPLSKSDIRAFESVSTGKKKRARK